MMCQVALTVLIDLKRVSLKPPKSQDFSALTSHFLSKCQL